MNAAIQLIPYLAIIFLGVTFANRWLVNAPPRIQKFPKALRIIALILSCWMGMFVASAVSNGIGYILNDGIAYDEGAEVPYEVMHDGVGANVFNLLFGWIVGFILWGIAGTLDQRTDRTRGAWTTRYPAASRKLKGDKNPFP